LPAASARPYAYEPSEKLRSSRSSGLKPLAVINVWPPALTTGGVKVTVVRYGAIGVEAGAGEAVGLIEVVGLMTVVGFIEIAGLMVVVLWICAASS
jgi:hypothetical protein